MHPNDYPHEPQFCVRPEDLKTYKQIISISDTYNAMEKVYATILDDWRHPWAYPCFGPR